MRTRGNRFPGAAADGQVWDWEPVKCHDVVEVSWNKVCDLSVNSSFQLVGCNHNQSFCAVWVINLKVRQEYSRASYAVYDNRTAYPSSGRHRPEA
jgi:katanin p80 WD40 repeat-containing subunit B1